MTTRCGCPKFVYETTEKDHVPGTPCARCGHRRNDHEDYIDKPVSCQAALEEEAPKEEGWVRSTEVASGPLGLDGQPLPPMPRGMKFMDAAINGLASEDEIEDWVDWWHDHAPPQVPLWDTLGMTRSVYARWVSKPETLKEVLDTYRRALTGEDAVRKLQAQNQALRIEAQAMGARANQIAEQAREAAQTLVEALGKPDGSESETLPQVAQRAVQALRGKAMCSVCAGTGKPLSGLDCICGGAGTEAAENQGLREALYDEGLAHEKTAKQLADMNARNGFLEKKIARAIEAGEEANPRQAGRAMLNVLEERIPGWCASCCFDFKGEHFAGDPCPTPSCQKEGRVLGRAPGWGA